MTRPRVPALWGAASSQGPQALFPEGPQDTFLQAIGTTNGLPSSPAWEPAVESLAPCRVGLKEPSASCMAAPLEGQKREWLVLCQVPLPSSPPPQVNDRI